METINFIMQVVSGRANIYGYLFILQIWRYPNEKWNQVHNRIDHWFYPAPVSWPMAAGQEQSVTRQEMNINFHYPFFGSGHALPVYHIIISFIIVFEDLWILAWKSQFEMVRQTSSIIVILTLVIKLKDFPIKFPAISGNWCERSACTALRRCRRNLVFTINSISFSFSLSLSLFLLEFLFSQKGQSTRKSRHFWLSHLWSICRFLV